MLHLDRKIEDIIIQLERVKRRFPDDIDFSDFIEKVERGDIQVFPIHEESVMIGQIRENTVRIIAAAGVLQEILDFLPDFCNWYRDRGCITITFGGRRGWSKYLLNKGWQFGDYEGEMVKHLGYEL